MIRSVEKAVGKPVTAGEYKRPEPCDDPRLERFYLWKDKIDCTVHKDFSPETFGPGLAKEVGSFFEKLIPLYEYFNRFIIK